MIPRSDSAAQYEAFNPRIWLQSGSWTKHFLGIPIMESQFRKEENRWYGYWLGQKVG